MAGSSLQVCVPLFIGITLISQKVSVREGLRYFFQMVFIFPLACSLAADALASCFGKYRLCKFPSQKASDRKSKQVLLVLLRPRVRGGGTGQV